MSRNTDAAVTSASQASSLRFRLLVSIESLSTSFYACTGDRFIYTMGNTYSPIGHLGGTDVISEDGDTYPRNVRAWISVVNSSAMHAALNEQLFRKRGIVHRCFVNESWSVVGTPQLAFKGRINKAQIVEGDQERGNFIEVEFETRLAQAPLPGILSQDTFQQFISTTSDSFMNYHHLIQNYVGQWGANIDSIRLNSAPAPNRPGNGR